MSVPKKRHTSGAAKRRRSHNALKPQNLIEVKGQQVPHGLKKAVTLNKKLMSN